jgi:hypothetical protein
MTAHSHVSCVVVCCKKQGRHGALFRCAKQAARDQPLEARAPRRVRRTFGSSVLLAADAPLERPPVPAALLELSLPVPAVPLAPLLDVAPLLAAPDRDPLALDPAPALGSDAPNWPADVPGSARPALSVSAGEPCAACAPAMVADKQAATNANVSLLMCTSRE